MRPLVARTAPGLLSMHGVGFDVAAKLLVVAGDNPERLRNDAAFANLCGVAPAKPPPARSTATASLAAATAKPTTPSTAS